MPSWWNGRHGGLCSKEVIIMDLMDTPEYHVYQNKDGRTRIYDKKTHKVTSYPRFIMSKYLGRTLKPEDQIHHIDGDPTNNDINNLTVDQIRDYMVRLQLKAYEISEVKDKSAFKAEVAEILEKEIKSRSNESFAKAETAVH